MPQNEPTVWNWLLTLVYAGFAGFGGALGYLMRQFDAKEPMNFYRLAAETAGAAFVGVLVMLLSQAMNLSPQWTGVVVGVSGWLGATATIQMLERVVRPKLGLGRKDGERNP